MPIILNAIIITGMYHGIKRIYYNTVLSHSYMETILNVLNSLNSFLRYIYIYIFIVPLDTKKG